jgi:predicted nucleic acid-binding protein
MVLVDTSSWIETLRARGSATVRDRISQLVLDGEAAWCDMVRLELWHGVRGGRESRDLLALEKSVISLEIDKPVWNAAIALAQRAHLSGLTVQAPDLVIAATARRYSIGVDSLDAHVERLMKLPEQLR